MGGGREFFDLLESKIQTPKIVKPKMKKNEDGSFSVVPNEFVKEVKCWKEFEIK